MKKQTETASILLLIGTEYVLVTNEGHPGAGWPCLLQSSLENRRLLLINRDYYVRDQRGKTNSKYTSGLFL
jgi:hypothetical protein